MSGPNILLATALCFPSRTAILPSSDRTLCITTSATVKLCETVSSSRLKSKHPWWSHRVLVMNLDMTEDILKTAEQDERTDRPSNRPCFRENEGELRRNENETLGRQIYRNRKKNKLEGGVQCWLFNYVFVWYNRRHFMTRKSTWCPQRVSMESNRRFGFS